MLRAQTGEGYPVICCSLYTGVRVCDSEGKDRRERACMHVCLRGTVYVVAWHMYLRKGKVEKEREKENQGDLCSAPAKVSDSWLIVYYCEWLCGPLRKPQEHYSLNQREYRDRVCLLLHIYPSIPLFCFAHMV